MEGVFGGHLEGAKVCEFTIEKTEREFRGAYLLDPAV